MACLICPVVLEIAPRGHSFFFSGQGCAALIFEHGDLETDFVMKEGS